MKSSTKGLVIAISIIGLGVGAYFLIKALKPKNGVSDEDNNDVKPNDTPSSTPPLAKSACSQNAEFPLMQGSKGSEVGQIQRVINLYIQSQKKMGKLADAKYIDEDCSWGKGTEEAVAKYYSVLGLGLYTGRIYKSEYRKAARIITSL